jgi:hypothetical protein
MTVDRERRLIWASIWPLEQDEALELRIVLSDPLPLPGAVAGEVRTRRMILTAEGGRAFYVSPAHGSDDHPGSREAPFRTLGRAVRDLQAGDSVYALSGVYRESVYLGFGCNGEPERPIVLMAAPGAKPVIDSSVQVKRGLGGWQRVDADVFKIHADFREAGQGYVAQDGLRMYAYGSVDDLREDPKQCRRAFYHDGAKKLLYVRTGKGDSPNNHEYHYAQHAYGFYLEGTRHVVVRGFEVRHCASAGIRLSGRRATGNIVVENRVHNSPTGIFIKDETTDNNAVWRNEVYEPGLRDFSWQAIKQSDYARQGIMAWYGGRGTSICYNQVHGWFDCVVVESWKSPDNLALNRDADILFNNLWNAGDDGLELDGGGVNMRVHGNRLRNTHSAISLAPVERGPVYVTRNDATYHNLLFKLSVGAPSEGWTYVYNNSGYCMEQGNEGTMIRFNDYSLPDRNRVFLNNAMIGSEWSVQRGRSGVHALDYNCYYNTPATGFRKFQWDETVYTDFATFQMEAGQERHGMYADPLFADTPDLARYRANALPAYTNVAVGDLRPAAGSPLIDRGAFIPGVTDRYQGSAPDIGAFEYEG